MRRARILIVTFTLIWMLFGFWNGASLKSVSIFSIPFAITFIASFGTAKVAKYEVATPKSLIAASFVALAVLIGMGFVCEYAEQHGMGGVIGRGLIVVTMMSTMTFVAMPFAAWLFSKRIDKAD